MIRRSQSSLKHLKVQCYHCHHVNR
ncbi:hypothetical protein ACR3I8_17220 [Priestia flexa]